jgi:hypothetical protein
LGRHTWSRTTYRDRSVLHGSRRGKGVSADRKAVSLAFQIEALPVAIVVHVSVSDRIVWNGTGETRTYPIEFQGFAKRRVLEGRFRIIAGR